MFSKIKNIIIVVIIIAASIFAYFFFFKNKSSDSNLSSSLVSDLLPNGNTASDTPVDTEFLTILLGIKDIKLNDSIFSDVAFTNLRDSSITLIKEEGIEGRKNPFASIGSDTINTTEQTSNLETL